MKKLRNWFIGDYLAKTDDVFEKARISLTFSYAAIFIVLGLVFYGNLITHHYWYHFIIITAGIIAILTIPFILKYKQDYRLAANIYLIQQFIVSFLETIIQGAPMNITSVLFNFVVVLFCLFVYGTKKGFIISLPFTSLTILEIINNFMDMKLVDFPFAASQRLPEQPIFILVPLALNIYVAWKLIAVKGDAEKQIKSQKSEIEIKNKEITDSINYAKRIQNAKLPHLDEIAAALPQSFIFFKPKDIVSGDFYYFHKDEKAVFIAAADCTGHGVPGAFMSIIGSEKLHDAVLASSDTSEVLKQLNKGIKASLKQTDSADSTRDGMDIALCRIDLQSKTVNYAGANRPIWIIRKGSKEVEEIKATKKAIGGLTDDEQYFDSHTIQLHTGDTFYIFSDGYPDMFGGADGKKLTTKRFRQALLDMQSKTMLEQGEYLKKYAQDWQGSTEQVDDILVIGVRL